MTRIATPMILAAALCAVPVQAHAQAQADCPEIESGEGHPIELRIGDFVLRAQVGSDRADGDGGRLEGRIVSCERERVIGEVDADAEAGPDLDGVATVLRLLHDFRIAFDLGPVDKAGCVRAGVDVQVDAGQRPTAGADRPLALEICGLPRR